MNPTKQAINFRTGWRDLWLCLTLSALLAACTGAAAPPAGTPEAVPPAASPTVLAPQATQPAGAGSDDAQHDLYLRWYTPVVASMYPFLICQSNVAGLDGSETGDARGQAAALIANRANAGREVLVNWEPLEEHQQIRTDSLGYLNLMIELSRQWYQEEIDGAAFREQMDAACAGAEGLLKDTAYLAREEGLTMETMQAISDRFEQALANP